MRFYIESKYGTITELIEIFSDIEGITITSCQDFSSSSSEVFYFTSNDIKITSILLDGFILLGKNKIEVKECPIISASTSSHDEIDITVLIRVVLRISEIQLIPLSSNEDLKLPQFYCPLHFVNILCNTEYKVQGKMVTFKLIHSNINNKDIEINNSSLPDNNINNNINNNNNNNNQLISSNHLLPPPSIPSITPSSATQLPLQQQQQQQQQINSLQVPTNTFTYPNYPPPPPLPPPPSILTPSQLPPQSIITSYPVSAPPPYHYSYPGYSNIIPPIINQPNDLSQIQQRSVYSIELFHDGENCPCGALLNAVKIFETVIRLILSRFLGDSEQAANIDIHANVQVKWNFVLSSEKINSNLSKFLIELETLGATRIDPGTKSDAVDTTIKKLMNHYRSDYLARSADLNKNRIAVLISGDRDFADPLKSLRLTGANVMLIYNSENASKALRALIPSNYVLGSWVSIIKSISNTTSTSTTITTTTTNIIDPISSSSTIITSSGSKSRNSSDNKEINPKKSSKDSEQLQECQLCFINKGETWYHKNNICPYQNQISNSSTHYTNNNNNNINSKNTESQPDIVIDFVDSDNDNCNNDDNDNDNDNESNNNVNISNSNINNYDSNECKWCRSMFNLSFSHRFCPNNVTHITKSKSRPYGVLCIWCYHHGLKSTSHRYLWCRCKPTGTLHCPYCYYANNVVEFHSIRDCKSSPTLVDTQLNSKKNPHVNEINLKNQIYHVELKLIKAIETYLKSQVKLEEKLLFLKIKHLNNTMVTLIEQLTQLEKKTLGLIENNNSNNNIISPVNNSVLSSSIPFPSTSNPNLVTNSTSTSSQSTSVLSSQSSSHHNNISHLSSSDRNDIEMNISPYSDLRKYKDLFNTELPPDYVTEKNDFDENYEDRYEEDNYNKKRKVIESKNREFEEQDVNEEKEELVHGKDNNDNNNIMKKRKISQDNNSNNNSNSSSNNSDKNNSIIKGSSKFSFNAPFSSNSQLSQGISYQYINSNTSHSNIKGNNNDQIDNNNNNNKIKFNSQSPSKDLSPVIWKIDRKPG